MVYYPGWSAAVLALVMVAGCKTATIQSSSESRILTAVEMDQITAGLATARSEATAQSLGSAPRTAVSATTQTYSGSSPIAGASFVNYGTSKATAAASNGEFAQAALSSRIAVDGGNGGAWIDADVTGTAAGNGPNRAQVSTQTFGISTTRADLVFGSVAAVACCSSAAAARVKVDGGAGGAYSREYRGTSASDMQGEIQSRVDIAVVSSAQPILDPAQMLVTGTRARISPKY
jgi:hypothetical protein